MKKVIVTIVLAASLAVAGGAAKAKFDAQARVEALEAAKIESDQAITILVARSEYLKQHLDVLEAKSGEVKFRASR